MVKPWSQEEENIYPIYMSDRINTSNNRRRYPMKNKIRSSFTSSRKVSIRIPEEIWQSLETIQDLGGLSYSAIILLILDKEFRLNPLLKCCHYQGLSRNIKSQKRHS